MRTSMIECENSATLLVLKEYSLNGSDHSAVCRLGVITLLKLSDNFNN